MRAQFRVLGCNDSPYLSPAIYRGRGRVLDGIVAVGDRFTHLRCRFTAEQEQTDDSVCVVDLIVQRILFYGRYINRLDSGMTCEIEFSGDLSIRLGPDDVLMGESRSRTASD